MEYRKKYNNKNTLKGNPQQGTNEFMFYNTWTISRFLFSLNDIFNILHQFFKLPTFSHYYFFS